MVNDDTSRDRTRFPWQIPALVLALFVASPAWGKEANHLYRIDVRQRQGFTRLALKLERQPEYAVSSLPGNRVRVALRDTDGRRWKRLRSYSDPHVGGVTVSQRRGDLIVTVAVRGNPLGVRILSPDDSDVLTIDVGDPLAPRRHSPLAEGREGIRAGVEQLLTRFDPPVHSGIPFVPTDRRQLEKIVPPDLAAQILAGEAALYQGQGGAAEEIFAPLALRDTPVRGLALFRLGEARYMLQKYGEALRDFREGERILPDFLQHSPGTTFACADSIARSGDLDGGRRMMARLIDGLADKAYAPMLLVRLADILARQGRELHAEAIYRSVAENFPGSKAFWQARMKLADRRLVTMDPATFEPLVAEYLDISQHGGDFGLREEGLFKAALLMSLYGDAAGAFDLVREYGRKFPRGVYAGIARGMREELLVPLWREVARDKDDEGLIRLAQENKEYLARCLADPPFVKRLSDAFAAGERTRDEATLFAWLADKEWSAGSAPELYRRIIDDAQRLGDLPLFEKGVADFLRRFPSHPAALGFREQLAAQEYQRGEMSRVVARLAGFLAGKQRPESVESLYYLGKALDANGRHKDAERAMTLFLTESRQRGGGTELVPDAYYLVAVARLARGDRKGGLASLRAGSEAAPAGEKAPFLYKMGEVARAAGRYDEAARYLKSVEGETKDPEWRKMAAQSLADIELQRSLAGKVKLR